MKLRMKGTTYKVAVNGAHLRQKADHLYNKCIYNKHELYVAIVQCLTV